MAFPLLLIVPALLLLGKKPEPVSANTGVTPSTPPSDSTAVREVNEDKAATPSTSPGIVVPGFAPVKMASSIDTVTPHGASDEETVNPPSKQPAVALITAEPMPDFDPVVIPQPVSPPVKPAPYVPPGDPPTINQPAVALVRNLSNDVVIREEPYVPKVKAAAPVKQAPTPVYVPPAPVAAAYFSPPAPAYEAPPAPVQDIPPVQVVEESPAYASPVDPVAVLNDESVFTANPVAEEKVEPEIEPVFYSRPGIVRQFSQLEY